MTRTQLLLLLSCRESERLHENDERGERGEERKKSLIRRNRWAHVQSSEYCWGNQKRRVSQVLTRHSVDGRTSEDEEEKEKEKTMVPVYLSSLLCFVYRRNDENWTRSTKQPYNIWQTDVSLSPSAAVVDNEWEVFAEDLTKLISRRKVMLLHPSSRSSLFSIRHTRTNDDHSLPSLTCSPSLSLLHSRSSSIDWEKESIKLRSSN